MVQPATQINDRPIGKDIDKRPDIHITPSQTEHKRSQRKIHKIGCHPKLLCRKPQHISEPVIYNADRVISQRRRRIEGDPCPHQQYSHYCQQQFFYFFFLNFFFLNFLFLVLPLFYLAGSLLDRKCLFYHHGLLQSVVLPDCNDFFHHHSLFQSVVLPDRSNFFHHHSSLFLSPLLLLFVPAPCLLFLHLLPETLFSGFRFLLVFFHFRLVNRSSALLFLLAGRRCAQILDSFVVRALI